MYARLVLPDNAHLDIQTATVKWCDNGQIGLEISEMERQDALCLLQLLSRLGGAAITYSRRYNPGSVTIGSGQELRQVHCRGNGRKPTSKHFCLSFAISYAPS